MPLEEVLLSQTVNNFVSILLNMPVEVTTTQLVVRILREFVTRTESWEDDRATLEAIIAQLDK